MRRGGKRRTANPPIPAGLSRLLPVCSVKEQPLNRITRSFIALLCCKLSQQNWILGYRKGKNTLSFIDDTELGQCDDLSWISVVVQQLPSREKSISSSRELLPVACCCLLPVSSIYTLLPSRVFMAVLEFTARNLHLFCLSQSALRGAFQLI